MYLHLSCVMTKPVYLAFPTGSDTNWAVQPQKLARGLEFQIKEVDGLYYLCNKNNGADQLCEYHAADLCFGFCIHKRQVFLRRGLSTYAVFPFKQN